MRKADRAALALERTPVGRIARRAGAWRGVLVLNYHRIGVPDANGFEPEIWSASESAFAAQVELVARNFEVVPPSDLVERPRARGRRVLLTFDDGYRDNFTVALPVLRAHGVTATFFVVPGFVDSPRVPWWDEIAWMVNHSPHDVVDWPEHGLARLHLADPPGREAASAAIAGVYKRLPGDATAAFLDEAAARLGSGRAPASLGQDLWMSWDDVRELERSGMTVGGHSLTHPVLARLDPAGQAREVEGCAARLKEKLGRPMKYFSYPVGLDGTYDATTRELLRGAGVELAFAFQGGYERGAVADPLAVKRAAVSRTMTRERFAAMITLPRLFAHW
jgi:peptidoglycan/xylan/chitin deacetylase (PgdA/CDA1 family)